ncbi:MAG: ThuA domain-containing protein [Bacteroidetes bacterium]|nr:ThuA domain-containing protein [Bacteroidota bacterium]
MKKLAIFLLLALGFVHAFAVLRGEEKRVLIYTKNGEGYVHENIAASVAALEKICVAEGILTDVSDQPSVLTGKNLEQYDAIIFSNSNNKGFETEAQKKAFQEFIWSGGGFAAIHSANATEREWPWYWALVGGKFIRHAPHQEFDVLVTDPEHPSTSHLPERWTINDECYYSFQLNPDIHVLLSADMTTVEDEGKDEYPGETFGQQFPLCWCHQFEGGRQWYTALGHDPWFYEDPLFVEHLRGGVLWILGISEH